MAGAETEQTRFHSGKPGVESGCDAKCDAISADRIESLARAGDCRPCGCRRIVTTRRQGVFMAMEGDGHVGARRQTDLFDGMWKCSGE